MACAAIGGDSDFQGQPVGSLEKPTRNRCVPALGCGLLGQQQERRMADVLGVVIVVKDASAQTQQHGTMAVNDLGKGRFLAASCKAVQQVAVGGWVHAANLLRRSGQAGSAVSDCHDTTSNGKVYIFAH
jgi:hypothetical protein